MAVVNTIDLDSVGVALQAWLRRRLPGTRELVVDDVWTPASSGVSSQMAIITVSEPRDNAPDPAPRKYVARIEPAGEGIMLAYDMQREFELMRALHDHTTVPVPRIVGYESDTGVLGAPFMLMEHVDGKTPADAPAHTVEGWVMDATSEQRERLYAGALKILTDIESIDWRGLDLAFLARPGFEPGSLEGQLDHWRRFFTWAAAGERNPVLEATLIWLEENRPAETGPPVLAWGDARIGNMIFGDDMSVDAVVDWECATLAPAGWDLGWWIFCQKFHTDGLGRPLPEGFYPESRVLEEYERLTGHPVRDAHYYEIFGGFQLSVYVQRQANLLKGLGLLPADSDMGINNPALNVLADLLGLPNHGPQASFSIAGSA